MEKTILTIAIGVLAVLMLCLMYRVVKGPRFTDRILAVNAINTMITAIICLLSCYLDASNNFHICGSIVIRRVVTYSTNLMNI